LPCQKKNCDDIANRGAKETCATENQSGAVGRRAKATGEVSTCGCNPPPHSLHAHAAIRDAAERSGAQCSATPPAPFALPLPLPLPPPDPQSTAAAAAAAPLLSRPTGGGDLSGCGLAPLSSW
jgi:hypothetical protein